MLLLEAGPDYREPALLPPEIRAGFNPTPSHDWGYSSEPGNGVPAIPLWRGKLVGGCSATNGMFALRGHPADYDEWAALGNAGWSFDELLPFFRKAESDLDFADPWHGRDGRNGDNVIGVVRLEYNDFIAGIEKGQAGAMERACRPCTDRDLGLRVCGNTVVVVQFF